MRQSPSIDHTFPQIQLASPKKRNWNILDGLKKSLQHTNSPSRFPQVVDFPWGKNRLQPGHCYPMSSRTVEEAIAPNTWRPRKTTPLFGLLPLPFCDSASLIHDFASAIQLRHMILPFCADWCCLSSKNHDLIGGRIPAILTFCLGLAHFFGVWTRI